MKKTLRHHTLLILVLVLCTVFAFPASASAKVKLSKTKVTIAVGKSTTLKLTGTKKKAKWSTSSKKIATVNQKGKVTAKAPGTCKITAKVGSKKYTCKVTVQQVTLRVMSSGTPVDTKQAISLKKGKNLTLSIQQGTRTSKKAAYKYVKAKTKKVTWKSSAPGIIAVNKSGRITAKKTGTAKITARYNGQKITFTVKGTKKKTSVPVLKTDGSVVITYYLNYMDNPDPDKINSNKVGYDSNGKLIPDPVREGYFFDGWYAEPIEDNVTHPTQKRYEVGTEVDESIDLYAKWAKKIRVTFANQPNIVDHADETQKYADAGAEMPIYREGDSYDVYIRNGTSLRENVGKPGTNLPKGWTLNTAVTQSGVSDPDDPAASFDGWYVPDTSKEGIKAYVCLNCGERILPLDGDVADGMGLREARTQVYDLLFTIHTNGGCERHNMYVEEVGGVRNNIDNDIISHGNEPYLSTYYPPTKLTMDTVITTEMFDPYVIGPEPGSPASPYYNPQDPDSNASNNRHSWCYTSCNTKNERYVKVTPHFSNKPRTVTFDASPGHIKGTKDTTKSFSVAFEDGIIPENTIPEAERDDGRKFLGWVCDSYRGGELVYPPNINADDELGNGVYVVKQNLTFHPVWETIATVHFEIPDDFLSVAKLRNSQGQDVILTDVNLEYDTELAASMLPEVVINDYFASAYVFDGWYDQPGGKGTKLQCPVKVSTNKSYYAHFVQTA